MTTDEGTPRRCGRCKELKPLADYYVSKKSGRPAPWCKECVRAYRRDYYHKQPKQKRLMQEANLRQYGLTPEEWEAHFEAQGRKCAACGLPWVEGERRFHTDHDHTTGQFRGILCSWCNLTLGHAQDDIARLEACLAYLRRFSV